MAGIPGLDVNELGDDALRRGAPFTTTPGGDAGAAERAAAEAAKTPPGWARRTFNSLRGSVTDTAGNAATGVKNFAMSPNNVLRLRAGGAALVAYPEVRDATNVAQDPNSSKLDVATQVAQGTGRLASASAGAALGAGFGSVLGPVGAGVGGVVGGIGGYLAADKAIEGGRQLLRTDPRAPVDQIADKAAAAAAAPQTSNASNTTAYGVSNGVGPGGSASPSAPMVPTDSASSPVAAPAVLPPGGYTRVGNSFSDGSPSASKTGFGVGTVGGSEGHRQNLLELERNAADRREVQQNMQTSPVGIQDTSNVGANSTHNRNFDKEVMLGQLPNASPGKARALVEAFNASRQPESAENIERLRLSGQLAQNGQALRIAQMNNDTQRRSNDQNNDTQRRSNDQNNMTALRGQDITLQGHLAPLQYAQALRQAAGKVYSNVGASDDGPPTVAHHLAAAAEFEKLGMTDQAEKARATATALQGLQGTQDTQGRARIEDTAKQMEAYFSRPDPKDPTRTVSDPDAARRAAATLRGVYPNYDDLSPTKKAVVEKEAVAKQKNMDAERQPMMGFVDRAKDLVGQYDKPPDAVNPRNLRGGKPERAGLISPSGVSRNSTLLRLPNGQTVNYGEVDEQQLADIKTRSQLR